MAGSCIATQQIVLQWVQWLGLYCNMTENCIAIGRFVAWAIVLQYT